MTREEAFEFLDRTARGIAEMFGSTCETLVHDMGVPTHPILSIYNGHVSGREVGSTMDIMGIGLELDEQAATTDQVNLAATTPDGHSACCNVYCGTQVAIQEQIEADEVKIALGVLGGFAVLVGALALAVSGS